MHGWHGPGYLRIKIMLLHSFSPRSLIVLESVSACAANARSGKDFAKQAHRNAAMARNDSYLPERLA